MFSYFSKMIFFFTLIMGTFITFSSSSWIGMWMGLELNLMSFIPLMIKTNNMMSTESSIKYFLIQTFASLIFLFFSITYIIKFSFHNFFFSSNENFIIMSSMMMKLGAAPFHFWFPNIIEGLSWFNSLILMTWQKIAPLIIISNMNFSKMIFFFIMISAFIGAIGGLNQTSLKKLLSFSSINHISWILLASIYSNFLWIFYFFIYLILNISIILIFKIFNLLFINQIYFFMNNNFILKSFLFMNFLSLGGLPPFLGFIPKWMILNNLMNLNLIFMMFFLIMMNLITLFFYIRLTFSSFMLSYPTMKWNYFSYFKYNLKHLIFFNMMTIMYLPLFLMMIFFI